MAETCDPSLVADAINDALPLRKLRDLIDRLEISADAKALLFDIANLTVQSGKFVLNIGRKILTFAFEIVRKFPKTIFGLVVATIVTSLIASIPWIGGLLAPIAGPLILAFGLSAGAINDMRDASWASRIDELEQKLAMVRV